MKEDISDTLDRLAPGVEPVLGEPLVFMVQSKSRAGVKHRVDFGHYVPNGSCTCENFLGFGRMETKLRRGEPMGPATCCEHIRRADRYLALLTKHNFAAAVERGQRDAVEALTSLPDVEPAF